MEVCPASLAQLRWQVEQQRAELRSHAHLVRTEIHLDAQQRRYRLAWWHHRQVAELAGQLTECRRRRERSGRRLAHLDAKLQMIDRTQHARAAWIAHAREILVRGVAAAQVLTERQKHDDVAPVVADGSVRLGAGSWPPAGGRRVAAAGGTAPSRRRPRWRLSCRTCWRAAAATTAPLTPPRCAWRGGRCWSPASAPGSRPCPALAGPRLVVGPGRPRATAGRG